MPVAKRMVSVCMLVLAIVLGVPHMDLAMGEPVPLSFHMARNMMYERNDSLKAENWNVQGKREEMESLKMLGGPTISAQAFELWGETKIDVDRAISTPLGSMPVDIDEHYNFSGPRASVTGTWPLFTGGKIRATKKAAKYAVDEAVAQRQTRSVELDAELIGRYFGLQLALSVRKLRMDMLAQQDRELEKAIRFERQGMISKVERLGVQVSRDEAERALLKATDTSRTARLQLARLMLEENFGALTTPLFVLKKPLEPMRHWADLAVANNPQIAVVEAMVKQAEQGVEAARSTWFPQVVAFGQYSFIRHYQTAIEPNWLAGLGVNLTLWDAKDRLSSFKSARATSRKARAARAEAVNQIKTGAETAWLNTKNAREQYNLTASNIELARENLRLKSRSFDEGLATALDVSEARDKLVEAEVARRMAAFEFVVNYAMLHAMAGKMDDFMNAFNNKDVIVEE